MAGIYIHVPFCKTKCSYCDFYSITNKYLINDYITALCKEFYIRKNDIKNETIETIYFGGGTPSILPIDKIKIILEKISNNFSIIQNPEITFEANPDDINKTYLKDLLNAKINRLSIGIQNLDTELLKFMNRKHSVKTAINSVSESFECGFNNISVDLIYGIPGLSLTKWEETIRKTLSLPITHLSSYHLTVEEKTKLHRKLKEGKFNLIDETESLQQYELLIKVSSELGFLQYEISNFAKIGYESKHNSSYWNGTKYIGFGPSAHSFYENKRLWNVIGVKEYIDQINNCYTPEYENLSDSDKINESIMLSLRTVKGINLLEFKDNFGNVRYEDILSKVKHINSENFIIENNYFRLTSKGMFISDKIIEYLFFIN